MEFLRKIFNHSQPPIHSGILAWVNELSGMDDVTAIEYVTQQLNADTKKNTFQDDQYLEALFSIDEKTHILVEKITAHYIDIDHMSIGLEERIANAVFLYHRQLFLIYFTLIENLTPFHPKPLLLMLARAIYSATQMIKWRYYNYQSAPANVWQQISKLYLIGEAQSLVEDTVQTYQDQEITTLSSAYIHACMLGSLESLSFKHQQIDLVSKMLTNWTLKILIQKEFDEKKHLFYVDTASDAPARRIRNFKPVNSYRYWCFDSINSKIELCLSLIEFNISPKQHMMKALIDHKYAIPTLETLRAEWSRLEYKRQRRGVDRIKTAKAATTIFGFEDTCYHIKQYENIQVQRGEKYYQGNKSFDERLASHHVTKGYTEPNVIYVDLGAGQSNIVDESSRGIGLYISKPANEVTLCMMVGVSIQGQKDGTSVGVIRSIKPIVGNELHIGVEVLSKAASCVEVKNISHITTKASSANNSSDIDLVNTVSIARKNFADTVSFYNSAESFTCLFLPKEFSTSKQDTLIVPRLHYNKDDSYKVKISGVDTLVKFTEALDQQENWVRVAYSQIIEKQLVT
jgi:hypothetical protein